MVTSPYHTIIGHIYYLHFTIQTYVILSFIYVIGSGGEYYFIVVSYQGLSILKMAMGLFDIMG